MTTPTRLLLLSLLAIANISHSEPKKASPSAAKSGKPEEFALKLYAEHAALRGPLSGERITEAGLGAWFSKGLTTQLWKEIQASKEEPGKLDFDVFYNSQDVQVTKVRVISVKSSDTFAAVTVAFQNYDQAESVRLNLRRVGGEGGEWRVSNVIYNDFDLLSHLVEPYDQ